MKSCVSVLSPDTPEESSSVARALNSPSSEIVIAFLPAGVLWLLWPGVAGPAQPAMKMNRRTRPRKGLTLTVAPQFSEVAIGVAEVGRFALFLPTNGQRRGHVSE